jgi:hypothetical protein
MIELILVGVCTSMYQYVRVFTKKSLYQSTSETYPKIKKWLIITHLLFFYPFFGIFLPTVVTFYPPGSKYVIELMHFYPQWV